MAQQGVAIASPSSTNPGPLSRARTTFPTILLVCGILSSLLYAAMLVFVPMGWEGYSSASQTVSELSAIDAPTRSLWLSLGVVWTLLYAAFGWGVCGRRGQAAPSRSWAA